MKTWLFKETGEKRNPHPGDWYLWQERPMYFEGRDGFITNEYPILSLTVCDSDPLEPIQKVYEEFKHKIQPDGSGPWGYERKLWLAVRENVLLKKRWKDAMQKM